MNILRVQASTWPQKGVVRRPERKLEFVESRRVSQGRIIVVLFWTKNAVPRQIKPGILKLTLRRGQSNFSIAYIFVSFEEKSRYRVVSVGQLSFDCRSYCASSRCMQGELLVDKCEDSATFNLISFTQL